MAAAAAMTTAGLTEHIRTLSSDEFGGRAPASPGGELTERYLEERFRAAGLEPGNGDSYFQEVPMVAITVRGSPTLTLSGAGASAELAFLDDYMGWTKRVTETASLDASELIFVGYGVVAPEYGWNDYEGLDVAGKTVVMHFNFAKVGVPSLYVDGGIDHVEHGEEWTLEQRDRYTADDYHKPSDEFDESWDLTGAIDDLILLFLVGHELASSNDWPNWSEGNEFRAIREADMTGGP